MVSSDNSPEKYRLYFESRIYQVFDDDGRPVLPCGRNLCITEDDTMYIPTSTTCANAKCRKRFRFACPGIIYCCQECFETTNTQIHWNEAHIETILERRKRLQKECNMRYLHTENGRTKKREQNKRCYLRRKESSKTLAAAERRKAQRLMRNDESADQMILLPVHQ